MLLKGLTFFVSVLNSVIYNHNSHHEQLVALVNQGSFWGFSCLCEFSMHTYYNLIFFC